MRALIIGDSEEAISIGRVFIGNPYFKNIKPYVLSQKDIPDFDEFRAALHAFIDKKSMDMVIADMRDSFASKLIPDFFKLAFEHTNVRFFNLPAMYEELYHRVPPSVIGERWLLENITTGTPHYAYDVIKRFIDICGALVLLMPAIFVFPCTLTPTLSQRARESIQKTLSL